MQGSPRRLSAVNFLSTFFQGRRHSTSDPLLRLHQRRRNSVIEVLSSSSHRVMVAISSVSTAEINPTFPERKRSSRRPTPKYTKVGERLRHVIPGHVACSMACGGRACKYENPARWSEQEQAIKGIYSSWVTDNILAMARPSTELIEKYNIIEQFQSYGIKTVINLQRPGEHASCGNTLEPESGFTYLPEAFMEAGIYFYNFGWKDYGVASLTTILDMVKVMTFALQEGKVAIHCHAGLGRTGVLIACYLVFATRMTADQAIIFVRAKRPNSIQTRGQLLCIREFTQFLIPLRNVFSCCEPKAHAVTLSQYLIRQRHLLHGYEARLLKHVPKIIHLVCKLLLDLAENRQVIKEDILKIPDLSAEIEKTVSEMVTMQLDKELMRRVNDASLPFTPSSVAVAFENQDAVFSSEHDFDPLWKRRNVECLQPLTHLKRRLSYSDSDLKRAEFLLEQGETPWTVPTQVVLCCDLKQQQQQQQQQPLPPQPVSQACIQPSPPLDFNKEALVRNTFTFWNQPKCGGLEGSRDEGSPLFLRRKIPKEIQRSRTFSSGFSGVHNIGESVPAKVANVPGPPSNLSQKADHCRYDPDSNWGQDPMACGGNYCVPQNCDIAPGAEGFVKSENQESNTPPQAMPLSVEARRVLAAKALANLNEFIEETEIKQKVEMWQKELNSRDGAWERICGEKDPFILCGLMWSWVEQLKEPVITKEDVDLLVNNCADASEALSLLEKGQHQTILCILHCIVNLQNIPADVEEAFLAHAIKSFTKINFDSENGPVVYHTLKKIFKHALEEKRKITKEGSEHTS
ncbi:protein tyrosine phosphatase domain-containing protein 1 isoform X2 [Antechinus flavipes]|uniref:protein tyrosine phosphatase domain-containing protein 1 isoform X2 n=1 Tax=Antechinus flavipes TaxID=38775 RepID=UPI0022359198|nr:protein tyrosine phosphatase domain-containing protein 1 isoform X2 [Antechinus flavipes]